MEICPFAIFGHILGSANNQEVAWDWIIDFRGKQKAKFKSDINDWNESNRWKVDLEVAHQGGRF